MHYDPDVAPVPEAWLALDEPERARLVEGAHTDDPDALHPRGQPRPLHARLTAVIETQIASRQPAVTAETVARLEAQGMRRHAAVHAVVDAFVGWIATRQPWDDDAWAARLRAIDASDWLARKFRQHLAEDDA